MRRFYDEVKLENELHPWNGRLRICPIAKDIGLIGMCTEVFVGTIDHHELSHIYRDLECEQHFVQPMHPKDKPSVPCLTPAGFESWMTKMIIAHPESEYERFAKAVLNMPISNADDSKERFPKELSRRLFPTRSNPTMRLDIDSSLYAGKLGKLTGLRETQQPQQPAGPQSSSNVPPTQPSGSTQQPRYPAPPSSMPPTNQDRSDALSSASSEDAVDESTPTPTNSNPIERQRKPYYAQPGQGKKFEDGDTSARNSRSGSVPHRSNTTSSTTRPYVPKPKEPLDDYGVAPRARGSSLAAPQMPPGARGRHRSQSRSSNPYTRSDTSVKPNPPFVNQGQTMQREDTYEENDLRRYSTQPTEDRRRQSRYDDMSSQASGASRDPGESREFKDARDLRDSRDYGPSSVRHEDDPRRSRTYTDYPPPPPPNYR